MSNPSDPYERLAAEYYDAERHPTCANFCEASYRALLGWLAAHPVEGDAVDIGCGDSVLLRALRELRQAPHHVTLIDSSPSMLAYSHDWRSPTVSLIVGHAEDMPLQAATVDFLLASLGDPYNDRPFWAEVRRVLRPGGKAFYTTPAWDWARRYRNIEGSRQDTALFILDDGTRLMAPSLVRPPEEQLRLIETAGLRVIDRGVVLKGELAPDSAISSKLEAVSSPDGPVVEWWAIAKDERRRAHSRVRA